MIKFNTFEEINAKYPINGQSNLRFLVKKEYCFILSKTDKDLAKQAHPFGWEDKTEHKWHFYDINQETWYDAYIYDGEKWILGIDTWDGICYANEPKWGMHPSNVVQRSEFGIFKTLTEAEEYRSKKLKELLEF